MTVEVQYTDKTQVKKVVVGRPVRRIYQSGNIDLNNVDLSDLRDGSVLVYNENTANFESTLKLEKQDVNGGNY
jgi:hypothetical protein